MAENDHKQRLDALEQRLAEHRARTNPSPAVEEHYTQAQIAWRMVTELVAGLGLGFGIGYGLDVLLGTEPWLMVTFTLLGLAAGVNVMLRTAREINAGPPDGHTPDQPQDAADENQRETDAQKRSGHGD